MAKYRGIEIPTHAQVADVIDECSAELAEWVRTRNTRHNCWGDMLLMVQRDYSAEVVVAALRKIKLAGWGLFVVETWCPYRGRVVGRFEQAKSAIDGRAKLTFWQKVRIDAARLRTIKGAAGIPAKDVAARDVQQEFMDAWKFERMRWIEEVGFAGLERIEDEKFFAKIIDWLKRRVACEE